MSLDGRMLARNVKKGIRRGNSLRIFCVSQRLLTVKAEDEAR
jgi:hypothetical protein